MATKRWIAHSRPELETETTIDHCAADCYLREATTSAVACKHLDFARHSHRVSHRWPPAAASVSVCDTQFNSTSTAALFGARPPTASQKIVDKLAHYSLEQQKEREDYKLFNLQRKVLSPFFLES